MGSHTPEPWLRSGQKITTNGSEVVIATVEVGPPIVDPDANARRIVACVNACRDIPTEELEKGAPEMSIVKAAIIHRSIAIDAIRYAIRLFDCSSEPSDERAQNGIQTLQSALFKINGGQG